MWLLARAKSNCEKTATENIARQGRTFYLPRVHDGEKIHYLFRPYLFVNDPHGQYIWLENTIGISQVIKHATGIPYRVPDDLIDHLKKQEDANGIITIRRKRIKRHELVKIVAGPHVNELAVFKRYRKSHEVQVLLHHTGHGQKLKLPDYYVERIERSSSLRVDSAKKNA